jgi:hypothetical protein
MKKVLAGLTSIFTVGFVTVASAFTCTEGLQICLGAVGSDKADGRTDKGCRQSFSHCMKTGRWVWVPTGYDWGPHERR